MRCWPLAALVLCGAATAEAQVVFHSGVDLVHFGVTVTTRSGELVRGLTADDFEVREAGVEQRIDYFAGAGEPVAPLPLHLDILLDGSGSMHEEAGFVHTAAIKFLKMMDRAVDYTVVDFDTEVRVARFPPADFPRLVERVRSRSLEGWTAFYDALGVYLDGATSNTGRNILVVYTDGADTRSALGFGDLLDLVKASDVTIYAIGRVGHAGSAAMSLQMRLTQIATASGGLAFFPTSVKELDEIYQKIGDEIAAQYTLGYAPTNTTEDGAWRKVEVRLRRPDARDYRLRTRQGYFAPYRQASRP
jgi:Ca-activated chloride channel family protein